MSSSTIIGQNQETSGVFSVESASGSLVVGDSDLLFRGDYSRDSNDLIIQGVLNQIKILDYFADDAGPALLSADGASLSFEAVRSLAGPQSPAVYAANGDGTSELLEIGKVVSLSGQAFSKSTNGIEVELKVDDPVFQGDVVRTGDGSDLGISFVDKTVFSLSSNATMILDELVYSPGAGSGNSMAFNLVQGAFVFVTGEIAPTGNMNIETPVATMGIRGTTPMVFINALLGVTEFSILPDPGSEKVGSYVLVSKVNGQIVGTVDSVGSKWVLTSLTGEAVEIGKSGIDLLEDKIALDKIREVFSKAISDRTDIDGSNSFGNVNSEFALLDGDNEDDSNGEDDQSAEEEIQLGLGDQANDDDPLAFDDFFTTGEDAILTNVNVITGGGSQSDYDPDGFTITVSRVDGNALTYVPTPGGEPVASVTLGSGALLLITPDGDITYDANDVFDFLGVGDSDTDFFTYTVIDPFGSTDTARVSITLTGSNDRPFITSLATTVHEDSFVETAATTGSTAVRTAIGQVNFSDLDASDTHTTSTGDPVVTWTSDDGVQTVPNLPIGEITLSLTETPPVINPVVTFDVNGNFVSSPPSVVGNVVWTYTVADEALDFLGAGETLELVYTVSVRDDNNISSTTGNNELSEITQDIVITITGTNDVPVITGGVFSGAISDISEDDSTPAIGNAGIQTADGNVTFLDVDLTDRPVATEETTTVQWLADDGVTELTLSPAQLLALHNAFTITNDPTNTNSGVVTWNYEIAESDIDFLAIGEVVNLVFTITVTDDEGAIVTQDITITVNRAGDSPWVIAATDVLEMLAEGNAALTTFGSFVMGDVDTTDIVTVTDTAVTTDGNDSDPAAPNEAALLAMLTYTTTDIIDGTANSGTVDWQFNAPAGVFDYLAVGEEIEITYTTTVSDDNGATTTQDIVILITGTNDVPVVTAQSDVSETIVEGNAALSTIGSFEIGDVDTTDIVTITDTAVATVGNNTDAATPDEAALLAMLTYTTSDIIDGTANAGTVNWQFNAAAGVFDYLAVGEQIAITYTTTVSDDNGATTSQDITVTITGTNDVPVVTDATDVSETLAETTLDTNLPASNLNTAGSLIVGDVDTTDIVTIDAITVATDDATGNPAVPTETALLAMLDLAVGDLVIDGTVNEGVVEWTFDTTGNTAAFEYLAQDESIAVVYTVTFTDDNGATTSQDISITITGTNDQPVIEASVLTDTITEQTALTGDTTPLTATGQIVLSDVDLTDTHTTNQTFVSAVWSNGVNPLVDPGTLVIEAVDQAANSADWTYTIADNTLDFLADGETLTITYDVTVQDDSGTGTNTSAVSQIVVTITGTNDAPTIAEVGSNSAAANLDETDAGLVASGTLSVEDVDVTDVVDASVGGTVTVGGTGAASVPPGLDNAALLSLFTVDTNPVINGSGTTGAVAWDFDSGTEAFDFLAEGETLILTYSVAVTDDSGTGNATDTQDVTITITGTNDAPVITSGTQAAAVVEIADGAVGENLQNHHAEGQVQFQDADLTDGVGGNYQALGTDYVGTFDLQGYGRSPVDGSGFTRWIFDVNDADIDWLAEGEELVQTYRVTLTDSEGATTFQDVTITITGTNDAPVVTADGEGFAEEGFESVIVDSSFTLSDVDNDTLQSAQMQIGGDFNPDYDFLEFDDQNGITGSYDSNTGILTLTGAASIEDYETALQSVTFYADEYSESSRTVEIETTVNDGYGDSEPVISTIEVEPNGGEDGGINYVNGDLEGPTADILQGTIGADVFFGGELDDTFVIDGEYGEAYELDTILDYSENDTINLDEIFDQYIGTTFEGSIYFSQVGETNSWVLNVDYVEIVELQNVTEGTIVTMNFDGVVATAELMGIS